MKQEKSCGVVIYRETDGQKEYLLLKSKLHGKWGFPKGHVEKNETERETAAREVYEEAGLKVTIIDGLRISIEYLIEENTSKQVVYFTGRADGQEVRIQQSEISDYTWVNYDTAVSMLSFRNLREVLVKVNKYLIETKSKK